MTAYLFVALFFGALLAGAMLDQLPVPIPSIYLGVSLATFIIYAWDKAAAKRSKRRVPEATLHYFAIFGGWPGAMLAQQLFRHKTRKQPFRRLFWMTVIINVSVLISLYTPYGSWLWAKVSQLVVGN